MHPEMCYNRGDKELQRQRKKKFQRHGEKESLKAKKKDKELQCTGKRKLQRHEEKGSDG